MHKKIKVLAIVPARGGSRGIPLKNLVSLAGRPLIAYTLEAAKKSGICDRIVVSTDNERIAKAANTCKVEVMWRPVRISSHRSSTESAMLHVLGRLQKEQYHPDVIVLLQATSPLRTSRDIRLAYQKFIDERLDSLLSVKPSASFLWAKSKGGAAPLNYNYLRRPRRQDMDNQYEENGAIFITKYKIFMKYKNRLGGKIGCYVMDERESIDIDTPLDLFIANQIIRFQKKHKHEK